jgi:hypothetical protein
MNEQQALQIIRSLADQAVKKSALENLKEAVIIAQAIDKLQIFINGSTNNGSNNNASS